MKPRYHRCLPQAFVVCFAPLLACATAYGSVVTTNESNGAGTWTLPSGTNLLTGRTPSTTPSTHEGSSSSWNTVIDGTLGDTGGSPATSVTPGNGETVVFPLDLVAKPAGYNITSFDSYCTWANSGRDNQDYMIQYSTVAAPTTFINIATVAIHTGSDRSTHTRLTDNSGFLATGVAAIKIIFDRQENGYVGYREFILQDTPTTVCVDNGSRDDNTWPPLVGPNLLAGIAPADAAPVSHEGSSSTWATLTDGSLGDYTTPVSSCSPNNGQTVTYPLDLVAKPAGYDITSFESYGAWGSNGRDDQRYTLSYSTVADPTTFLPLTEVWNHTEYNGPNSRKSTRTRVTGNGGKLALGVAAIQLTFHDQENGYTGFRELILRDTALPTTIATEANGTNLWTLPSGTNLLSNSLAKTPATAAGNVHGATDVTSPDWTVLTDGSLGSAGTQIQSVGPNNGTSVIFPLDISTNTKGYNLTSLDSYCAWGDSGRDNQNYTVSYSTVTDPATFILIDYVNNATLSPLNATHSRIAATTGVLAANVGAVKYDFANQENGWTGFRELIALGNAVPLSSPLTWSGLAGSGGAANWVTTADNNWMDNGVSSSFTSIAPLTFDNTGVNTSINIPAALTAASLTFANDASHPFAFSGQLLTVTNSLTQTGAGAVTFNNPVASAGVAVSGTGSLSLTVDNPLLTGSSTVNNGVLNLTSDGALGSSSLGQTGGRVNFTSPSPVAGSIAGTGGTIALGNPAGAGASTTLSVGNFSSSTYGGAIVDASVAAHGSLAKNGSGMLALTGANTYTGTTTVYTGELKMGQRLALYNGDTASWTAAKIIVFSDLTLQMGGGGEFTSSDVAALGTGGFDSTAILGLDTSSGNAEISDSIGGSVRIEKEGINTLRLSAANTFTQGITVTQGTIELANPGGITIPGDLTLGNGNFDVFVNMANDNQFGPNGVLKFHSGPGAPNAKAQLRGTNQTIAGLESSTSDRLAILQNDEGGTPGYTSDPGPCSLTINTDTGSFHSFHGIIRNQNGGAFSLVKNGLGTQEIINSAVQGMGYSGPTTVNAGKFRFNFSGGNTGFSSNINVAAAATLEFHAVGGDYNFDRLISGDGQVLVNGVNAVRMTNNVNSWTGGTTVGLGDTIYQGFLALEGNGAAGEGTAAGGNCVAGAMIPSNVISVLNGATLALDGVAPLGNSGLLPDFATSIRITEHSTLSGGSNTVAFVANITLDGGKIEITSGAAHGGFNTDLTFVGTLVVGGSSTVPSVITTTGTGAYANASLGSLGLPGTTFQVADVTSSSDPDLLVDSILQDVGGHASPLTKTGPGTLLLTGANTYTGTTTVLAGTLAVSGNSIADSNKLVIDGGKVDIAAASEEVVGTLFLGSVQQDAGSYGSSTSGATHVDDTRFSGDGILTVSSGPYVDPYIAWSAQITDPAQRGRDADPDGDGFTNLQEFLFGTSPIANTGALSQVESTPAGLLVSWNQLATSGTYILQESTTMMESPWPTSTATITDNPVQDVTGYVRKQALIPLGSAQKFVRIEAHE
ncbi:MAG: autotransporter-associated beta strand repeat-containing protein [Verrucomicrobiota bacterium]